MLGPPELRRVDQLIAASLENLVARNNVYRHLEVWLDLTSIHDWVREWCADRGRPSIDPVVFTLQLIGFFERIRSEGKLIETASFTVAHRWYLDYVLGEALLDRQVCSEHFNLCRKARRLAANDSRDSAKLSALLYKRTFFTDFGPHGFPDWHVRRLATRY